MRLFNWIIETSWQASVLALGILLFQALCGRRISSKWRYNLWLLLVLRLLLPSLPESPTSVFNIAAPVPAMPAVSVVEPMPPLEAAPAVLSSSEAAVHAPTARPSKPPISWKTWCLYGWLAGMTYFGLRLLWTNLRFAARIAGAKQPSPHIAEVFDESRESLGVARTVALAETDSVETPCVYGLFRKRVLLPAGFSDRFSPDELRHVFRHELAHIKRRDLEVNWIVALLTAVHWFNPVLWFAFARMRADREIATDALALSVDERKRAEDYGETILKVLETFTRNAELPQVVGIVESKSRVKERIRAIARHGMVRTSSALGIGVVCVLVCFTFTAAVQEQPKKSVEAPQAEGKTIFAVQTVDRSTEAPLEGIRLHVKMTDYEGNAAERLIVTGQDGHASLPIPKSGLKTLSYRTLNDDFVVLHTTWHDQDILHLPEMLKLKMTAGIDIGGTVVDENGKPIAGAELLFNSSQNLSLESRGHGDDVRYSRVDGQVIATTDENGAWIIRHLWPTWDYVSVRVRHREFAQELFTTDTAEAKQSSMQVVPWKLFADKNATLTLPPGVSVKGRVVDERGNGLPGILVQTRSVPGATFPTDSDGRFQIAHLPKKTIHFTVQSPDFSPETAEFDAGRNEEITIRLKRGLPLKGVVKDQTGKPVSDVAVRFADWGIWRGVNWETRTDANGKFVWNHAPESKFLLKLEKEGYVDRSHILQGGQEKELRVMEALRLSGKVLDEVTQQPIKSFRLSWTDREEMFAFVRSRGIGGTNGLYSIDLSRIYAETWGDRYFHRFLLRIEADGYEARTSRLFDSRNDGGPVELNFSLKPSGLTGMVVGPDGQPVAGAQVALKTPNARLRLAGKPRFENVDKIPFPETSAEGRFRITGDPQATHLVAVHEQGFGLVEAGEIRNEVTVRLQPWARVEGVVKQYATPLANEEVLLNSPLLRGTLPHFGIQFLYLRTHTDFDGRYSFHYLPPTKVAICRMIKFGNGASSGPYEHADLKPGETREINLGGEGRPVVGRFKIKNPYTEVNLARAESRATTAPPQPPANIKSREEYQAWARQESINRAFTERKSYVVRVAEDGSFRMDEVVLGKYELSLSMLDPRDPDALAHQKNIVEFEGQFEIPSSPPSRDKPHDIGEFEIQLKGQPGHKTAPEFTAKDLSEKSVKLSDFRGKYVLLDFWATWCGPCIAEMPYLKKVHERFGGRKDFVLIGVSMDKTIGDAQAFVEKNKLAWTQLFLPDAIREQVQQEYEFRGIPAKFLIDPEGKIVAENIQGVNLVPTLQSRVK